MVKFVGLILVVLSFLPTEVFAQNESEYKDFLAFKEKFQLAVDERNSDALNELLYDRIFECWDAFDCAGEAGCLKDDFLRIFFPDSSSQHWNTLSLLLNEGFQYKSDTFHYSFITGLRDSMVFVSPAYHPEWDEIFILKDDTQVFMEPSVQSKSITIVKREAYPVEQDENENPQIYEDSWIKIQLKNEQSGYVKIDQTSLLIDRELIIGKINGNWKIFAYLCQFS